MYLNYSEQLGPVTDSLDLPHICPYPFPGDSVTQIGYLCVERIAFVGL